MTDAVLTINAGSSSLKFSVYHIAPGGDRPALAAKGQIEGIGTSPRFVAEDAAGERLVDRRWPEDRASSHAEFFRVVGSWLREQFSDTVLLGVGHRVVHGGVDYAAPVRIEPAVLARLEALCPLAPLHQPHNLAGIRAVAAVQPDLPQVACFDTAFHRGHPELADWFALPRRFYDEGIRRYGFHGLSYEYIASVLPEVAPEIARGRVVVAHLGSGASMCAMTAGRSIDSTMGFTALDGLPMGTRCGALDPGVVLHLIRAYGMDADAIERMLYHECGLKGVSGYQQRHARAAWQATTRAPARRSTCSSGGSAASSARSPRSWAASTASCSRPGSASARPRSVSGSASAPPGSASSSTMRPIAPAARASRPMAAGSRSMRSRPTRSR